MPAPVHHILLDGHELRLTHLDRVLYPHTGFTKSDMIRYYDAVAPVLLPHLQDRPVSRKRFPDGVDQLGFFEKNCPSHHPPWVRTWKTPPGSTPVDYCVANDRATLLWLANLSAIELHTHLHRVTSPHEPTMVVFDLDPGPPAGLTDCASLALELRALLRDAGLETWIKHSGGKGLHALVPLNIKTDYEHTRSFSLAVAQTLERHWPARVVSKMTKSLRTGKVLVDWSQNHEHKTTVCVYSLRAMPEPSVSRPLHWEEIERWVRSPSKQRTRLGVKDVQSQVKREGDLMAEVLTKKQKLPGALHP